MIAVDHTIIKCSCNRRLSEAVYHTQRAGTGSICYAVIQLLQLLSFSTIKELGFLIVAI
jgi:hypothetical protein